MLDVAQVEPLLVAELHYIEVEDIMSIPFPPAVKKRLKDMMPQTQAPMGKKDDSNSPRHTPPHPASLGHRGRTNSETAAMQSAQKVYRSIWGDGQPN